MDALSGVRTEHETECVGPFAGVLARGFRTPRAAAPTTPMFRQGRGPPSLLPIKTRGTATPPMGGAVVRSIST